MMLSIKNTAGKLFSNRLLVHFVASVEAILILFTRRPDAFLNPQFWAEDGVIWYAQAYKYGFSCLIMPYNYYQIVQRIISLFSQFFPMSYAPSIFNLSAIAIKIVVVNFLISKRFSSVVPKLSIRILFCFVYLASPNSYEVNANLTNFQWHLALLTFLIIISESNGRIGWKIFDTIVCILSSLSGPFCIFLVPIAFICWSLKKEKRMLYLLGILSFGSLIQFYGILNGREHPAFLGASVKHFTRIAGGQVFVSSVIGSKGYQWMINYGWWKDFSVAIVNITGFMLLGYSIVKAKFELKLFILFSSLIFIAALASPTPDSSPEPVWKLMSNPYSGSRYWFIPVLCYIVIILYNAASAKSKILKGISICLLVILPLGIISDWEYFAFTDFKFSEYALTFENTPSGTEVKIPVNPGISMTLIKK